MDVSINPILRSDKFAISAPHFMLGTDQMGKGEPSASKLRDTSVIFISWFGLF
jgi:hypothetical protein